MNKSSKEFQVKLKEKVSKEAERLSKDDDAIMACYGRLHSKITPKILDELFKESEKMTVDQLQMGFAELLAVHIHGMILGNDEARSRAVIKFFNDKLKGYEQQLEGDELY